HTPRPWRRARLPPWRGLLVFWRRSSPIRPGFAARTPGGAGGGRRQPPAHGRPWRPRPLPPPSHPRPRPAASPCPHGHPAWSGGQPDHAVAGHGGCRGLRDRGRAQAEALRDRLAATGELGGGVVLYASMMHRAVETATILAPALGDPEIRQECDVCEFHPGMG